ncbi:MAG: hypothetical protein WBD02_10775 [Acidimicrobiia bacterium]
MIRALRRLVILSVAGASLAACTCHSPAERAVNSHYGCAVSYGCWSVSDVSFLSNPPTNGYVQGFDSGCVAIKGLSGLGFKTLATSCNGQRAYFDWSSTGTFDLCTDTACVPAPDNCELAA